MVLRQSTSKKKSILSQREVAVPRWKVCSYFVAAPVYIGHLLFAKHHRVYL